VLSLSREKHIAAPKPAQEKRAPRSGVWEPVGAVVRQCNTKLFSPAAWAAQMAAMVGDKLDLWEGSPQRVQHTILSPTQTGNLIHLRTTPRRKWRWRCYLWKGFVHCWKKPFVSMEVAEHTLCTSFLEGRCLDFLLHSTWHCYFCQDPLVPSQWLPLPLERIYH
jgi:hypothetical protein